MQLTIRQWFRKNAKYPVYFATALIIAGQLFYTLYSLHASRSTQAASLKRMSEIFSLAVDQHNRTLIESALGVGIAELNASLGAFCERERSIISIPTDSESCKESRTKFGYRLEVIPLIGMPQYTLRFVVPWIDNAEYFLFTLGVSGLFLASAYLVLNRMQNKLRKELLEPLARNIAELNPDALADHASINVVEIRNLYVEYLSKLESLKKISQENEKNAMQAAISQTAQMVAHDVRRPFALMQMFLSALRSGTEAEAKALVAMHAADVEKAIEAAKHMMKDVLEFGAEKKLIVESMSASDLIADAVSSMHGQLRMKDIELHVNCSASKSFSGDRYKLLRVLENVISNAIDAMPRGARLEVEAVSNNETLFFSVRNSGSFVSDEMRRKIFSPLVTEGKRNGFGLGLAIVKKYVESHGGTVTCTSSYDPMWTEFSFSIPIEQVQQIVSSDKIKAASKKRTVKKVLIVDDDIGFRNLLDLQFKELKKDIPTLSYEFATNFSEAKAKFEAYKDELVLCDVELGRLEPDGFELATWMRSVSQSVYICMHSNIEPSMGEKMASSAGANEFLSKGLSVQDLRELLLRAFDEGEMKTGEKPELSVVDDDLLTLRVWQLETHDAVVNVFRTPEDFLARAATDSQFLKKQSAVVTDLCFSKTSASDGLEFAKRLKDQNFSKPVLLSTNGTVPADCTRNVVTAVIPKKPASLAHLMKLASATL